MPLTGHTLFDQARCLGGGGKWTLSVAIIPLVGAKLSWWLHFKKHCQPQSQLQTSELRAAVHTVSHPPTSPTAAEVAFECQWFSPKMIIQLSDLSNHILLWCTQVSTS